jgi:hypothetical protein
MTSKELLAEFDRYFQSRGKNRSAYVPRIHAILGTYQEGTNLRNFLADQMLLRNNRADKTALTHFQNFLGERTDATTISLVQDIRTRNESYDEEILQYLKSIGSTASPSVLAILVKDIYEGTDTFNWSNFLSKRNSNPAAMNFLAGICLGFLKTLLQRATDGPIDIQGCIIERDQIKSVALSLEQFIGSNKKKESVKVDKAKLYDTSSMEQVILFLLLEVGLTKDALCRLTNLDLSGILGARKERISFLGLSLDPVDDFRPKAKAFPNTNSSDVDIVMRRAVVRTGLGDATFPVLRKHYKEN